MSFKMENKFSKVTLVTVFMWRCGEKKSSFPLYHLSRDDCVLQLGSLRLRSSSTTDCLLYVFQESQCRERKLFRWSINRNWTNKRLYINLTCKCIQNHIKEGMGTTALKIDLIFLIFVFFFVFFLKIAKQTWQL